MSSMSGVLEHTPMADVDVCVVVAAELRDAEPRFERHIRGFNDASAYVSYVVLIGMYAGAIDSEIACINGGHMS